MTKILILGGGFGGVRCALDLSRLLRNRGSPDCIEDPRQSRDSILSELGDKNFQITLLDKNSYHLFLPSLYEVAAIYETSKDPFAVKMRKTVCIPYGEIFAGKNINFIQAEMSAVDLKTNNVRTKGGEILSYDYLVIALGSQTADFGIPGVREYAYQFKSIDDALAINIKIGKLIKKMASGEKMDSLRILIGGAGFTGVELAAELSRCCKKMCREHNIKGKRVLITLIEAGPKILPMISDKKRKIISKHLTELGVVLMENSPIEEVEADFVKLKNGQALEGGMVIWTAGIKTNEFLKFITGLPITDKGKIVVDDNLQVREWKNVFAAGDNQEFMDTKTQKPVPALAYTAVDQGKVVAENIFNSLNGKNLKTYEPYYGVWIAPVGGKFALANLWGGWSVSGFMGWVIRELVDFRYLVSILSFRKAIIFFWQEIMTFTKND